MKVFKGCAVALLSLLLFLTLIVFGLSYTVDRVVLSPGAVKGIIHDIDFAALAAEVMNQDQSNFTPAELEIRKVTADSITNLQPLLKEKLNIAIDGAYAKLRGGSQAPDLKVVLGRSLMNAEFTVKLLAGIDLKNLADSILDEQSIGSSENDNELRQALLDTLEKIQPDFKKQVVAASDPVFKYILGQTDSIDVRTTVRNTLLSDEFIFTVIDNFDAKTIFRNMLNDQLGPLPEGYKLTGDQLDRIAIMLEPSIKNNLKTASGPIADYLVGKTSHFNVTVSIQPVLPDLKPIVRELYLAHLPEELQNAPEAQIDRSIENYWNDFLRTIPLTFSIDETMFDSGLNTSLNNAFGDLEKGLNQARDGIDDATQKVESRMNEARIYASYFRAGFAVLVVLMLVVIAGIILIHRSVRGACRDLGITILIYGALTFVGIMLIRYMIPHIIVRNSPDIPAALADLLPMLAKHLTSPLFAVSLVCIIGGIALIVVSVIYPNIRTRRPE